MLPKLDHHILIDAVCGLLATGAATVVAVVQSRFDPDIVAVLGAMLAAVVAVIEARKKDRSMTQTVSVLIASAFFGSVIPGAAISFFFPERMAALSWQAWATLGFVVGLLGWSITAGILALRSRVTASILSEADRLGLPKDNQPPP